MNAPNKLRVRRHRRSLRLERLESRDLLTTIDLGQADVTIFGAGIADESGIAVRGIGDVNGDGYDDVLIGARYGDAAGNLKNAAGESYLIFGNPNWSSGTAIDLANLGSAGVRVFGADTADFSGRVVSPAGDVNGDGFHDFVIGAPEADAAANAKTSAGDSYLIFGKADWSTTPSLDLGSLGSSGVTFHGADSFDFSGRAVGGGGDVNGDGYDDLVIGAHYGDAAGNARDNAGESVLIFGKPDWSATPTIDLANVGSRGVIIYGSTEGDDSGISVSNAGDINGDGFDDILIGARYADSAANARYSAGDSYLIFGKASWTGTPTLDLASLGSAGITFFGIDIIDYSGLSVSRAGDVDGDGFDDLLIGALGGDGTTNGTANTGETYLIFGKAIWPTNTVDLANLGSDGTTIYGVDAFDNSGFEVSSAGDVNGDGFDDLLIGARYADAANNLKTSAGDNYVLFGKPDWPATVSLADAATNGILLLGVDNFDYSGFSVSTAGDVNGDGFDDVIIGAPLGDAANNAQATAGESYLIFGGNEFTNSVTRLGTPGGLDKLSGTTGADIIVADRGDDNLVGLGGADVLKGGQGKDLLVVSDLTFRRLVGGSGFDTLQLATGQQHLDLTAIPDNRVQGIEQLNITNGTNTLTLSVREVLRISHETNTLIVKRDFDDVVNIGSGWIRQGDETIDGNSFEVYTAGAAILKIQSITADVSIFHRWAVESTVVAGNQLLMDIEVSNDGPAAASGIKVELPLPSGLTFLAGQNPSNCSAVGQLVTCTFGIAEGATSSVRLRLQTAPSLAEGQAITTTASIVEMNEVDPTLGDHSSTTSVTVHRIAELAVRQTPSTNSPIPGGMLTYAIQLPNTGPSDASGVVITDTLPSAVTFDPTNSSAGCTANGQIVTCNVGVVPGGGTVTRQIATIVNSSTAPGTVITNTASIVLNEPDPTSHDQTSSLSLTVGSGVDLSVTKTASVNPVIAGGSFHYTIQVRNDGPLNASGVVINDNLSAELTFDAANSSNSCSAVGQAVTCTIGTLAGGGQTTRTIAVLVASATARGTVIGNTATVTGNDPDADSQDQTSTVNVTSNVSPDPLPWQNVKNAMDVNNDSFITPNDVLQIFNELNGRNFSQPDGALPIPPPSGTFPFFDVSGDNFVVPNDAIRIINFLNAQGSGEGEAAAGDTESRPSVELGRGFVIASAMPSRPYSSGSLPSADERPREDDEEFHSKMCSAEESVDAVIEGIVNDIDQIWCGHHGSDLHEALAASFFAREDLFAD